jgi:hypothetical protein
LKLLGSVNFDRSTRIPDLFGSSLFDHRCRGEWMEHLWSPAGATGRNRWQMGCARKPLKQVDPQLVATHGNRFGAHGKEGVDGSSPSEGSAKAPHVGAFAFRTTCS